MKIIKKITFVLFILVLLGFGAGIYVLKVVGNQEVGNKIVGFSVLVSVFIVVPLFLFVRLQGKKLKDYTLTKDNIERWREELDKRKN